MIFNDFQNIKISSLGFGTMRLPCENDDEKKPDLSAVCDMVDEAIKSGVNYFDTAWGYHDGLSEITLGKALSRYSRESYFLADKFPGYDLGNMPKVKEIFNEQLKKCQTEYFNFYLFHNVCEKNIDAYLDPQYGICDYFIKMKKEGKIKHLGFSTHGDEHTISRFLEAYGKDMEFCQLQINFIDWKFQHADRKVQLLKKYNIPIWVMEPVRGGRLAALDDSLAARLRALRPEESIPAWAFRFLQGIDGIGMVLSGMSDLDQLRGNIATMSESRPLFANRSYLSTPPELLQVLILYFSFFGQTAQSEPLMSVITAKNNRREVGKALLPPNI